MAIKYILEYTDRSQKELRSLSPAVARRIVKKLDENIALVDPLQRAKVLTGELAGVYRYRIGDYRVLFDYTESNEIIVLMILKVGHRKNVYNV